MTEEAKFKQGESLKLKIGQNVRIITKHLTAEAEVVSFGVDGLTVRVLVPRMFHCDFLPVLPHDVIAVHVGGEYIHVTHGGLRPNRYIVGVPSASVTTSSFWNLCDE